MLCDHLRVRRECIDDVPTGDYVCIVCGKVDKNAAWVFRDRAANQRARAAEGIRERRDRSPS